MQVFEDFGSPYQALIVRSPAPACIRTGAAGSDETISTASSIQAQPSAAQRTVEPDAAATAGADLASTGAAMSGGMLLQEVHVLRQPGAHSLLDFGSASICYSVGGTGQPGGHYGPALVIQGIHAASSSRSTGNGSTFSSRHSTGDSSAREDGEGTCSRRPDTAAGGAAGELGGCESWEAQCEQPPAQLNAGVEAAVCRQLAAEAQALLSSFATSMEEDEALLQQAGPEPQIVSGAWADNAAEWTAWTHRRLAVQYRLARKRLLQRVASDVQCQARMVSEAEQS